LEWDFARPACCAASLPPGFSYLRLKGRELPLLYGFSESVIPRPADWPNHLHVTGYWFLDSPAGREPPEPLASFIVAGPAPVFVGFGSMVLRDPEAPAGPLHVTHGGAPCFRDITRSFQRAHPRTGS